MRIGTPRPGSDRRGAVAVLAGATLLASPAVGTSQDAALQRLFAEEPHLGVVVRIEAFVPQSANPARAFRAAFDRIADLERKLSSFREDSELRRVEERAWREPVPVSNDLSRLLQLALAIGRESGGAFDPAIGAVTRLARERGLPASPDQAQEFARARLLTGWQQVLLDAERDTVFLRTEGVQFDLGGIAKGFIADEALRELANHGIASAVVSVAGDIAVGDPPPGERGWTVGLDAVATRNGVERILLLSNKGVSTSGSRERFHKVGERRCSHILAPEAGSCIGPNVAVSVVAPTAAEADGVATALLALGQEQAESLLSQRSQVEVYWAVDSAAGEASTSLTRNVN